MSGLDDRLETLLYIGLEWFAARCVHYSIDDKATPTVKFFGHVARITELRGFVDALGFHLSSVHNFPPLGKDETYFSSLFFTAE